MPKIEIVIGPNRVTIENDTVENVADLLRVAKDELGIPDGLTPVVNGAAATAATPLADGDEVAFNDAVGQKGDIA